MFSVDAVGNKNKIKNNRRVLLPFRPTAMLRATTEHTCWNFFSISYGVGRRQLLGESPRQSVYTNREGNNF